MASTADVFEYIQGIRFPASKRDCLEMARQRNAPATVLDTLDKLPERQFHSMSGIWHALGDIT